MYKSSIYLIITLFTVFSCKTSSEAEKNLVNNLPKNYGVTTESTPLILPERSVFFNDSVLNSLINTSLEKNFDVQSALQRVQQYHAEVLLNKGIRLPDLSFNGSVGQRQFGKYTMDGVGNYDTNFSPNIAENQKINNPS